MSLQLHEVLADGTVRHSEFTRQGWEGALKNPEVVRRWGHPKDECLDPVEVVRGARRSIAPAPAAAPAPIEVERTPWPPSVELRPWMLCFFTGMSPIDARELLKRRRVEPEVRAPRVDKKGQYSLF